MTGTQGGPRPRLTRSWVPPTTARLGLGEAPRRPLHPELTVAPADTLILALTETLTHSTRQALPAPSPTGAEIINVVVFKPLGFSVIRYTPVIK